MRGAVVDRPVEEFIRSTGPAHAESDSSEVFLEIQGRQPRHQSTRRNNQAFPTATSPYYLADPAMTSGASPDLSVLIPTRDERWWLPHTVAALRASARSAARAPRLQIIVCDAGSVDGTPQLAATLADEVITHPAPRSAQLNAGLARASAPVVLFLHADALVGPGVLDGALAAIEAGAVGGWCVVEVLPERPRSAWTAQALTLVTHGINARTRRWQTATGDQAIFARRDVLEQLGGVPALPMLEGWELARALARVGEVVILDEPARISGRRWERGPIRVTLEMWLLRAAYLAGADLERLHAVWDRPRAARRRP